ncbi:MAG TPA: hypothetical protein VLI39_12105 [Sedimentisphaerales bacterium]|nr:hypothetical protein [Sedimentisphaerales bacterium]
MTRIAAPSWTWTLQGRVQNPPLRIDEVEADGAVHKEVIWESPIPRLSHRR